MISVIFLSEFGLIFLFSLGPISYFHTQSWVHFDRPGHLRNVAIVALKVESRSLHRSEAEETAILKYSI
jgi:hypothetical protein